MKNTDTPSVSLSDSSRTTIEVNPQNLEKPINSQGPKVFDIRFIGYQLVVLSDTDILLNVVEGNPSCGSIDVAVISEFKREVTISDCSGDGRLELAIKEGVAVQSNGDDSSEFRENLNFEIDNNLPVPFLAPLQEVAGVLVMALAVLGRVAL